MPSCTFFVAATNGEIYGTSGDFDYQLINNKNKVEITGYFRAGGHINVPE
jgi:hypothetical protein